METGGESLPEWILLRVSFFSAARLPTISSSAFLKDLRSLEGIAALAVCLTWRILQVRETGSVSTQLRPPKSVESK